jgi:hypothetical protein
MTVAVPVHVRMLVRVPSVGVWLLRLLVRSDGLGGLIGGFGLVAV